MRNNKRTVVSVTVYTALFSLLYILTYSSAFSLKIANASPMPMVALVAVIAFYHGEWVGFSTGLVFGIFCDAVAGNTMCFNTVILMLIGCAAGVLVTQILNKSLYSLIMLTLFMSGIYFLMKYVFFYLAQGNPDATRYLIFYAVPSAVYTAIFSVPIYYIGKFISAKTEE